MTNGGMRALKSLRAALFCTAISIGSTGAAWAQDTTAPAPAPPPATGDQSSTTPPADNADTSITTVKTNTGAIIVTAPRYVPGAAFANKANIPLIETPQSVSVVTRDQIDLLNFVDAQQAVRYTAGVSGENYGPDLRFDFINVRGFTPKQYIDGLAAPISTTIYSVGLDLYAFQSLELLKGPASVLYGNAPPGGIYNETSRRPSRTFDGEIQAKYGNHDYKSLAGTVSGSVSPILDLRMTALGLDRDAERDFVTGKRYLLAPSATLHIGDSTRITALAYYQYDKVRGDTNGFLPVYGTLLPNPNGPVRRSINLGEPKRNLYKRRQYGVGWDLVHDFSDSLSFQSNVKWSHYKEVSPDLVYGGGGLLDADFDGVPDDFRTVNRFNFNSRERVRSFAADNRLSANVETGTLKHKILVGLDYRNVFNFAEFGFGPAPSIDLYDPVYVPDQIVTPPFNTVFGFPVAPFNNQKLKQTGLYAQDVIQIGHLYATLGGRYDWVNVHNFTSDDTQKQHKFTYRAGLNYVLDNGLAPYIGYATSFEPVLGKDVNTGRDFVPSTGRQIEGGVKFDGRRMGPGFKVFATAALFDIKERNVVSATPSVLPVGGSQSGEVEVYGGELEFVARIREQLSINGSYSYTHSKVVDSDIAQEIGAPLPVTPKHKASLFVDYSIQQGTLAGLGFGFGARYVGRSAGSLPGPFNLVVYNGQASTLFDGIVHYDVPGWRFAINGSNIFDKRYVARCAGPANCTFGAGRQIIGTVTKRFR